MLRSRLIPFLSIHNGGLVKSKNFKDYKYLGDPINAVKVFNDKEVDELAVIDISASISNNEPNYKLIESIARESRMPLTYGGGVKNTNQARKIISLGVEKIAISSGIIENLDLISELKQEVGSQSVVFVIDIKKSGLINTKYSMMTHNGSRRHNFELDKFILRVQELGIGEIVINSIDHDGSMKGYDLRFLDYIMSSINVPLTFLGGAGSLKDINNLVQRKKFIGAGAGSIFLLKGIHRAPLIQYPDKETKEKILGC